MTIYLSNDDVRNLLPMSECVELTEKVFRDEAVGQAINLPRTHLPLSKGMHRTVFGIAHGFGVYGMKTYGSDRRPNAPNRTRYLVMLYDLEHGGLEAIVEARDLGQIRTGAAAGVASALATPQGPAPVGTADRAKRAAWGTPRGARINHACHGGNGKGTPDVRGAVLPGVHANRLCVQVGKAPWK